MAVTPEQAPVAGSSPTTALIERWQRPRPRPAPARRHASEWRWLWPIVLVGFLLRLLFLERVPNSVTADELDFASNALQVLSGQGPGLFGLDWTPEPALGLHFMVGSMSLFGVTLFAERLVAAVLTTLSLFPFYALLRRVVSQRSAVLTTLLFAAARWYLLFSRSGWNNGDTVLFMLLAAWCLTAALERKQQRYWLGFGGSLALLLYGYFAGRAVVLAFALYLGILLVGRLRTGDRLGERLGGRALLRGSALAAAFCLLLVLPEVPTVASNWDLFNRRTADVFILHQPLPPGETPATLLASQAWKATRSFLFQDPTLGAQPTDQVSQRDLRYKAVGQSWLDPVSASLFVIGMLIALSRRQPMTLWWCLLLVPLAITQVFSTDTPDGARALPAVAPMFAFAALTIDALLGVLARRRWAWEALLVAAALVALYNVVDYARWVDAPATVQARQPGVPVQGFYTWRDFQLARLQTHLPIMSAGEYDQLSRASIAAQIAGVANLDTAIQAQPATPRQLPVPSGPPTNGPAQHNLAHEVGVVGAAGDAPGSLEEPRAVAADSQGNLYVTDSKRQKVVKYAADGHFLLEWGAAADGPTAKLQPWSVVALPDGTLDVDDEPTGRVLHFDDQGRYLGEVAVTAPTGASRGMAAGLDGRVYLAQTPANRVARFTLQGAPLPSLGEGGAKLLDQPTSAVAEANGTVFIYEPDGGRLALLGPDGRLLFTLAAPKVDTVNGGHLTVLPDGRVLLTDLAGRRVIVYGPDGRLIGDAPVNGAPVAAAVTPSGTIAVADLEGKVVRLLAFGS